MANKSPSVSQWFDGLEEFPPTGVPVDAKTGLASQSIWLTVLVPADARPGDYEGKVTVSADGSPPADVRVALKVIDWQLPRPHEFVSQVGLIESPETVALQYNVKPWSDEHWKLVERSFAQMAAVGADDVYIPVLSKTVLGNEHGMVRWIRQADPSTGSGQGGGYKYDFGLVEKYLDIAARRLVRPPVVCLYLWDRQGGEWMGWGTRKFDQTEGPKVTVLDPASGELTALEGPKWGTPQAVEFWKPVIEQAQRVLARHGLAGSLMFGIAMDQRPPQETIDQLKAIAPAVPWVIHSHGPPTDVLKGQPIGYGAHVHVTHSLSDPAVKREYGWQTKNLFCAFPRYGAGGAGALRGLDLGVYRAYVESMFVSGHRGVGRVGADFWPVIGKKGRQDTLYCRYAVDGVSIQIDDSNEAMLAPGRDGAISTGKLEMLREGVQEVEARVFIEKALLDPAARARLGDELATKCQSLLDDRTRRIIVMVGGYRVFGGVIPNWQLFQASGWQQQSEQLYQAAADAAAKLAAK